ncbi:MAG: hypothetical protein H6736_10410 [Alphaproteobacteria bacterium]|nr:hypothetical protein [Alphaproteobacteria bacterium]MCB9692213.1 hypothetical protein [Alphaproteobacteria bacterium]
MTTEKRQASTLATLKRVLAGKTEGRFCLAMPDGDPPVLVVLPLRKDPEGARTRALAKALREETGTKRVVRGRILMDGPILRLVVEHPPRAPEGGIRKALRADLGLGAPGKALRRAVIGAAPEPVGSDCEKPDTGGPLTPDPPDDTPPPTDLFDALDGLVDPAGPDRADPELQTRGIEAALELPSAPDAARAVLHDLLAREPALAWTAVLQSSRDRLVTLLDGPLEAALRAHADGPLASALHALEPVLAEAHAVSRSPGTASWIRGLVDELELAGLLDDEITVLLDGLPAPDTAAEGWQDDARADLLARARKARVPDEVLALLG